MNYEERKKLINNIVDNEFDHVQNENLEGMDELEKYNNIAENVDIIQTKLFELLPNEHKYLLDELDTKVWEMVSIQVRHYFKKGVAAGTSNLNFLRDITNGVNFY